MKMSRMKIVLGVIIWSMLLGCSADVTGPDRPPVARAGLDLSANVDQRVILDGSASWDPDGDPIEYQWKLLSIPSLSSAKLQQGPANDLDTFQASLTPDVEGVYLAGLTVSANGLDSRMDVVRILAGGTGCTKDKDCDDGLYCNGAEHCMNSECQDGQAPDCSSLDGLCTEGTCNEQTDQCEAENSPAGTECDDGLYCTVGEACDGDGTCQGGTQRDCSAGVSCMADGVCNEDTDQCEGTPLSSGTPCDDGLFCTVGDSCDGDGICLGGSAKDCSEYDGECTVGVCNENNKLCESNNLPPNTACDDGLFCSVGETCDENGTCQGGTPRDCSASGGSCVDGTCNEDTDACEGNSVDDDTPCDDDLTCTTGDRCLSGVCTPAGNIDCSGLDDQCTQGVCSEPSGTCVANPVNESQRCDDSLACTTGDQCVSGVCTPTGSVDCSSLDDQCNVGTCQQADGSCIATPANENQPCDDSLTCSTGDTCVAGTCTPTGSVDCSNLDDQCNVGTCQEPDGSCIATPANETQDCDDGLFCKVNEVCSAGQCVGQDRPCPESLDPCKVSFCDEANTRCDLQDAEDGTLCDDESLCTENDVCTNGVCAGTDTCPMGCNDAAQRCYEVSPSNVAASYMCMDNEPDLVILSGQTGQLDTDAGSLNIDASLIPVFFAPVDQASPMPQIAVFSFASMNIEEGGELNIFGSRAAALLVCGDATINGHIWADAYTQWGGPGGFDGGDGNNRNDTDAQAGGGPTGTGGGPGFDQRGYPYRQSAGGGGAYGMAGGIGGLATGPGDGDFWGGDGGVAFGSDTIEPLVGGAGGGGGASYNQGGDGGGGGGAVQITAGGDINIGSNGSIDVTGAGGGISSEGNWGAGGGGGAGGGLILEAQSISIDGTLAANGGGGGGGRTDYYSSCSGDTPTAGEDGPLGDWRASGGTACSEDHTSGDGGQGGANYGTDGQGEQGGEGRASGGGGGAMGRIRINTYQDSGFSNFGTTSPYCGDTGGEPTTCTTGSVKLH